MTGRSWPEMAYDSNPYTGLPMVGMGMTGYILQLDGQRVVKVAKVYPEEQDEDSEYINEINRETLENEISIYKRLGHHRGIIHCFQTSNYGIELAFANDGNLEDYISTRPEPAESLKREWILSAIDTLSYVHSQKVLVDEIALRNFLVADGQLKLADFGQSYLLALSADMTTVCENDLTAKIEILHLGWVLYSIAVWHVHKYYFFNPENEMQWPDLEGLPLLEGVFFGYVIKKCWSGEYTNMSELKEEAHSMICCDKEQIICSL